MCHFGFSEILSKSKPLVMFITPLSGAHHTHSVSCPLLNKMGDFYM